MAEYKAVIDSLQSRLRALDAERAAVVAAIAALSGLLGTPTKGPTHKPLFTENPRFAGMTVRKATEMVMEGLGNHGIETTAVANILQEGGVKADSKSFKNQVYNVLYGMSREEPAKVIRDGNLWFHARVTEPSR